MFFRHIAGRFCSSLVLRGEKGTDKIQEDETILLASTLTLRQCLAIPTKINYHIVFITTGDTLPEGDIISSHAVHSQVECSLICLQKSTCVGYNYRPTEPNKYVVNCQLTDKTRGRDHEGNAKGKWRFYQTLKLVGKI